LTNNGGCTLRNVTERAVNNNIAGGLASPALAPETSASRPRMDLTGLSTTATTGNRTVTNTNG
jgi:hypothetical protein